MYLCISYNTSYIQLQVISTCILQGTHRYYVHYVGWNSRYDEWVDHLRISCKRGPDCIEPEGGDNNDSEVRFFNPFLD